MYLLYCITTCFVGTFFLSLQMMLRQQRSREAQRQQEQLTRFMRPNV